VCSSKPKIPNTKTPPAPNAPEPAPDAPIISERGMFLRGRGFKIAPKPDLSGLGNQTMGPVDRANQLFIGPSSLAPVSGVQIDAAAAAKAAEAAAAVRRPRTGGGRPDTRRRY
jgi:hypothetical protein